MGIKLIIAGSRNITDEKVLIKALREWWKEKVKITTETYKLNEVIEEIISGGARGVDTLGENFAKKFNIKLNRVPAQWDLYGKSAGYKRNEEMAKEGTHLIALWDGLSKGTGHMIDLATKYGLDVFVFKYVQIDKLR